jgi:RecA/RadA recombinase
MAGDGISLPTTIAQMGSVAKTQAKGQQAAQPAAPFAEQIDKKDDLKIQRVKESQKAEQQAINPDQENEKDKRRRRRLRRNRKYLDVSQEQELEEASQQDTEKEDQEQMGRLIDLRV